MSKSDDDTSDEEQMPADTETTPTSERPTPTTELAAPIGKLPTLGDATREFPAPARKRDELPAPVGEAGELPAFIGELPALTGDLGDEHPGTRRPAPADTQWLGPTDPQRSAPAGELPPLADTRRPVRRNLVAGVLTCVLVIMGIGMLVAQIVSGANGQPGPGALAVGAHLAGAAIGVCCYQVTARRTERRLRVAVHVVLLLVIVVLAWVFWLSPS